MKVFLAGLLLGWVQESSICYPLISCVRCLHISSGKDDTTTVTPETTTTVSICRGLTAKGCKACTASVGCKFVSTGRFCLASQYLHWIMQGRVEITSALVSTNPCLARSEYYNYQH